MVNWGLVVRLQGARWEGLVGCKIFAKACDLGGWLFYIGCKFVITLVDILPATSKLFS